VVVVALALALAACSSSDSAAPTTSALTAEQANRLANVLFDNYDGGGATFQVATASADGGTVNMTGEVDWQGHFGHATVSAKGTEAGVTEVYWSEETVLEQRPELNRVLVAAGRAPTTFVARTPDPANRDLDRAIAIVAGLASEQRDNPLLIQQETGSSFVRNDTLRGVEVEVLRYGTRNLYWIDAATGLLLRFEGNSAAGGQPVVVDILQRGPQTITGPIATDVVGIDLVRDFYPIGGAK
jgi:hypothetical protein